MERSKKAFKVKGKMVGGQRPMICIPLVGKDKEELIKELHVIKDKQPDIIEWRADYFKDLDDESKVVDALRKVSDIAEEVPLLFTIRSEAEGGQQITLNEKAKLNLLTQLMGTGTIDFVDYELDNDEDDIKYLRNITDNYGIKLITSYHNFRETPPVETIFEKGRQAEDYQADMVKISVMPNNMDDVLVLLEATQAINKHINIPVVSISMGEYGSISRMFGWKFGSAITFGIGEQSSAPGQIPVEDLRSVINIIEKTT
ncbi:type I 3-dehydroquinate dehydratase [Halobacillus shinanisalinarum]|uniref:3-dehydroquinate dehydratase n=1 Tax=Halobacillus shinanisalinarum TaxID=2932258 RepID=A0ABY4GVR3_9BACI|nr:type I 3-dehydroquinate dehydratase [Halobacillus shinanisalinarum]UOQ91995.1 type I 3-dehydroquinate dehydratase [Halobacillus shinanisalinarum]